MPGELLTPSPGLAHMGLFGKLPAHGDFVRRGNAALAQRLDRWLTGEVDRLAAGDGGEARLASLPTWCFTLPGGYAGALAASRDSVGRLFPIIATTAGGERIAEDVAGLLTEERAGDADAIAAALAQSASPNDKGWPRWWPWKSNDADTDERGRPDFARLIGTVA